MRVDIISFKKFNSGGNKTENGIDWHSHHIVVSVLNLRSVIFYNSTKGGEVVLFRWKHTISNLNMGCFIFLIMNV